MKINKREIARVLETMGKMLVGDNSVVRPDGQSIDIEMFNKHPLVEATVIKLKHCGVKDNKHLTQLGFVPAGMIMRF